MTAQIAETLYCQGEELSMCTNPLDDYFVMAGIDPPFQSCCTALWRGYIGTWEVVDDRLYLIALNGMLQGNADASLETIFPGFPDRVFAHWYSGTIRVPQGKQLKYVHLGYASIFERDLIVEVERGVVVDTRIIENGNGHPDGAPEGYGVAAMTVFPGRSGRGGWPI